MDINTSIGVHDAFSQPLRDMQISLNNTISSFQKMQDISSTGVDTTGLRQARNEINMAETGFNGVGNEINESAENQRRFNKEIRNGNNNANTLYSTFRRLVGVAGLLRSIKLFKDGFNVYKEFNLEMATLEAVTLATGEEMEYLHHTAKQMGETTIYSASQSAKAMTELAKGGLEVYEIVSSIPEVLNLSAASGMELAKSAGITVDIMRGFNLEADQMGRVVDLIAYTSSNATTSVDLMGETFGYSAKIADTFNASIEETAALIGLMSSAAKGSKAGTALRSGFGRMANPTGEAQEWLDRLQVDFIDPSTNELYSVTESVNNLAMAFEGLSNAQQIQASKSIFGEQGYNAWLAVIKEGQGAMNDWLVAFDDNAVGTAEKMKQIMLNTTDGVLQLHKSEVEGIWISFYEGLADGAVAQAFQSVLGTMRTTLEVGLNIATGVFSAVGTGIEFVKDNIDLLLPIMFTYIGALAVLNAEMIIGIGIRAAHAISYAALTTATMVQATATFILTLATQGLSAALAATPLGWVAAGLVIIVGTIFLGVAAFNRLADTSYSAMGIIGGGIAATGAFIMNTILGVANFVWGVGATVMNGVISFAEFLANIFDNPLGAIGNLFADLGHFVLDTLLTIANTIDTVFGSNLSQAVSGWKDSLSGLTDELFNENKIKFDRVDVESPFNRMNYGEAWDSGYEFGDNLGNKFKDMFSFDTPDLGDNFDFDNFGQLGEDFDLGVNGPGGINDLLGDIGNNTKSIKDSMDMSDEDTKYLRDLAANTIMGRLTNAEINFEVNNNNTINSELDIDGVVNSMTNGLEENVKIAMEGIA